MSKIKLEKEGDGQTFIYPNEEGNGVTISQDEMRIISEDYHEIYDAFF